MTEKERYTKNLEKFCATNEWFESAPLNEVSDFLLVSIDEKRRFKINSQYSATEHTRVPWDKLPYIQILSGKHAGKYCVSFSGSDNTIKFLAINDKEQPYCESGDLMLVIIPTWGRGHYCISHGLSEFKLALKNIALDLKSCKSLVKNADLELISKSEAFTTPVLAFAEGKREILNTVYQHINFPMKFLLEQSLEAKYIYSIYEALISKSKPRTYTLLQNILDENSTYIKKYTNSFPKSCPKCNKPIPFFDLYFDCKCSHFEYHADKFKLLQGVEKCINDLFYDDIAAIEDLMYNKTKRYSQGRWIASLSGGKRNPSFYVLLGMGIFFRNLEDKYGSSIYSIKTGTKIDKVLTAVLPENADSSEKEAYDIIKPFLDKIDDKGKELLNKVITTIFQKRIPDFKVMELWGKRAAKLLCKKTDVKLLELDGEDIIEDDSTDCYIWSALSVQNYQKTFSSCKYFTDYIDDDFSRLLFVFEMIFNKQQYEWGMPEFGNFFINIIEPAANADVANTKARLCKISTSGKVKLFTGIDGLSDKAFKDIRSIISNDYIIESITVYEDNIEFQMHKGQAEDNHIVCTIGEIHFNISQNELSILDDFSSLKLLSLSDRADEYEKALSQLEDCPFIKIMTIGEAYPHNVDDRDGPFSIKLYCDEKVPYFNMDFYSENTSKIIDLEVFDNHMYVINIMNTPEFLMCFLQHQFDLGHSMIDYNIKNMKIPVLCDNKWANILDKIYCKKNDENNTELDSELDTNLPEIDERWRFNKIQNIIDNLKILPVKETGKIEAICKKARFTKTIYSVEDFRKSLIAIEKDKLKLHKLCEKEITLKSSECDYKFSLEEFYKDSLLKFDLFISNHRQLLDLIKSGAPDAEKYKTLKHIDFKDSLEKSWQVDQPNEISLKLQGLIDTLLKQYTSDAISKADSIFKEDTPLLEKYQKLETFLDIWDSLSQDVSKKINKLLNKLNTKANILEDDKKSTKDSKLLKTTVKDMAAIQLRAQAAEHERKIAQAESRIKEQVIADLSHHVKNLVRSVIDPLEHLKSEHGDNEIVIENALKGAELIREIVNAMNLSFQGSHEDFLYDFIHTTNNSKKLKDLVYNSLRYAVMNMFSGKYFANFVHAFFEKESVYNKARSSWLTFAGGEFEKLNTYLSEFFFDIEFDVDQEAGEFIVGDEKGSAVKLMILFQEILLNAVKYSAFVDRSKRFVRVSLKKDNDKIIFKVINSFNSKKKVKTAGLGHVIIENFSKLLDSKANVKKENDCYSVTIGFRTK